MAKKLTAVVKLQLPAGKATPGPPVGSSLGPHGINIPDRRTAIRQAIKELEAGDVLIVAGKGHEPGQIIKGVTYPFSDHEEVLKA